MIREQKKKIMYLHSGAELYGADQILFLLTANLDKAKYDPVVVLPNDGPLREKLEKAGVRVKIIFYPIIRRKYFNLKGIFEFLIQYRKAVKRLEQFALDENVSMIHSNTLAVIEGASVKKKTGVPLLVHLHEMIDHPRFVAKILYKIAINGADKVAVVSNAVKRHIEGLISREAKNLVVIHNGLEPDLESSLEKKKRKRELGFDEDKKLVAIVGRVNAIKGQDHFIDMMKKLDNDMQGAIVGDAFPGQEWRVAALRQNIINSRLEDRVKYLGFVPNIDSIFQGIDVLVLPSVQNDSFPTVVLESFKYGKPVVAYRCGGVEEMIDDGVNGYLVSQGDIDGLVEAVNKSLSDKRYNKLSEAARETLEKKFSLDKFIEKFENVYEALA